ncbi:uncharacterized protein LAESUDRAFT_130938 [Laetiporus sulphureus 93-53]|uniref:Uncharacterized protein n=1 Tax=Laetiporus sulphureus 93-53 TaxID=1314785 RepID=A0A165EHN2_9APHY|nr:uncharacterized protein LAESUDRAFT_130938 [Laetiporus sulphureus 93-53]KZT07069.1 hypothetical protein LAESUDRAFT_130938 [Laetiporus sulphureus 93-53]
MDSLYAPVRISLRLCFLWISSALVSISYEWSIVYVRRCGDLLIRLWPRRNTPSDAWEIAACKQRCDSFLCLQELLISPVTSISGFLSSRSWLSARPPDVYWASNIEAAGPNKQVRCPLSSLFVQYSSGTLQKPCGSRRRTAMDPQVVTRAY